MANSTDATTIYHLIEVEEWTKASEKEPYFPATYKQDGFTHATHDPKSLISIANHFYRESKRDWICLAIDVKKLKSPLKWESPAAVGDKESHTKEKLLFPHVYGPLYPSEVTTFHKVNREEDGKFTSIEGF
mmetsp:Transcript_3533/g.4733  ORF Transcript_3533/g.4733 Transcript_3533/m.4733 type:complete len:131 (-) Transcript_3533:234-626(-)